MANTWINETEYEDITERIPLRNKLHNFKGLQEKPRRKAIAVSTEERREKHKEKCEIYGS